MHPGAASMRALKSPISGGLSSTGPMSSPVPVSFPAARLTMIAFRHPRRARRVLAALAMVGAGLLSLSTAASAQTLEKVKARGSVICGVNPDLLGFSTKDAQGSWSGFDIDLCRALAAAIFNDPSKVQFTPLATTERLRARSLTEIRLNDDANVPRVTRLRKCALPA